MSATSPTRRDVLATSATAAALGLLPEHVAWGADGNSIRRFEINVPEEQLLDLRRRINATR